MAEADVSKCHHGVKVTQETSEYNKDLDKSGPSTASVSLFDELEDFTFDGELKSTAPTDEELYWEHKRITFRKASKLSGRRSQKLDGLVQCYKPVSDHKHNIKKREGNRKRDSKEKVMEMLFAAFEKQQHYNFKSLVNITNQPVGYLKEILNDLCVCNLKSPHKNMWKLKPEYCHYNEKEKDK